MSVDRNLLSEFAKITNDTQANTQTQLYGTVVTQGDKKYVKMDGSDIITPIISTTDIKDGERVMVSINNHIATVTGNITNPSAGNDRVSYTEGKVDEFDYLFAGNITAENIAANSITADKLLAGSITTDKLMAESIIADKIAADAIESKHIKADVIESKHIKADAIEAEHIKAGAITADKIDAGIITSDHISSGTITAENIATGTITAGSGIIAEGAIGSAQISSLDVAKLESGTIDTSKIYIAGADGHLQLKGNRLQVFDGLGNGAVERVSVGDVNGDGSKFGLRVRGADGETILLDENGVTSEGITDGSITNNKISDDANIDGAKLNINSVVSKINEDGTEVIKGTKISVNGTNLESKLYTIENTQSAQGNTITQNTSKITANEKAIALKVDTQTYKTDKENMTSQLTKNTSSIEALQNEISLKVESTDITNAINNIQVGGRNFILNSNFIFGVEYWYYLDGVIDYQNKKCAYQTMNATSGETFIASTRIYNEQISGKTITLSFLAACTPNMRSFEVYILSKKTDSGKDWDYAPSKQFVLNEKLTKYTWTYTMPSDIESFYIRFDNNASTDGQNATLYITDVKFEIGNKATDWTPAPEDITSEIDTKIYTAKSEIKITTDAITQNVSNLSQTVSNKADGSTVSSLNSKVSSLETSVNGISGKVTSLEKTTTTLGTQVNTANTNASSALNKANNATTTANNAQNTANANKSNITDLQGEVSTVKNNVASLEVTTSGISQKVSSVESTTATLSGKVNTAQSTADSVNNKLNNLAIGGRNYIKNSKSVYMKPNGTSNYDLTFSICDSFWENENRFGTVILSFDVEPDEELSADFSSNVWFRAEPWYSFPSWTYPKRTKEKKHYTLQASLKNAETTYKTTQLFIRFQTKDTIGMTFTNVKLEISTKPSDWTPAPEDVDGAINSVDGKVTTLQGTVNTTNSKVATLETNLNGITQRVSSTESTTATLTTKVNNAQNTADNVNNKLEGLKIGGTNLLKGTKDFSTGKENATIDTTKYYDFTVLKNNVPSTGYADMCQWTNLAIKPNTEYTLSFYAKASVNGAKHYSYLYPDAVAVGSNSSGATTNAPDGALITTLTTEWKRYWVTWKTRSTLSGTKSMIPMRILSSLATTGVTTYICGVHFEEGNRSTDWSPSPEDVSQDATNKSNQALTDAKNYTNTQITTVNNKVASIQTDLNGITSRVTNTENNIQTTNNNVTNLTNRVTTAESKITETAITNTVKKNFYTKTETDSQITSKGYQTSSQVQQTVDALQMKFEQSGGYNLLKNSAFKNGANGWSILRWDTQAGGNNNIGVRNIGDDWTLTNRNSLDASVTNLPNTSANKPLRAGFDSHKFKVRPNTTYTLNCLMAQHRTRSITIEMLCYDSADNRIGTSNYAVTLSNVKSGGRDRNNWTKVKHTWTTPSNAVTCHLRAYMNEWAGESNSAYMWICEPLITEGNSNLPWTPNADEVYTGITTIDKEGITVNQSNISTYTTMDASSFRVENNTGGTIAEFSANSNIPNLRAGVINSEMIYANNIASKTDNNNTNGGFTRIYYVQGNTGVDSPDRSGNSWSTAFKSVQYVLDNYIEDILNHHVQIKIGGSTSYWSCNGRSGRGVIEFRLEDDCVVSGGITIEGCTSRVRIYGNDNRKGTLKNGINIIGCNYVDIGWLSFRGPNWAVTPSCGIYILDGSNVIVRLCDFNGMDTPIVIYQSDLWIYGNKGSQITNYIGIGTYSRIWTKNSGTDTCPDYTGGYMYTNRNHAETYWLNSGCNFTKTPSDGWSPNYTPTQRTSTWSFNKIWSDETLHGWSDRQELIQGYASTWNTGRWTGYMQMTDDFAAIRNTISGGTNLSGRIYIQRTSSSGNSTGSKLCLYGSDGTLITNSTSINRSQGVWVSLSSSIIQKIQSGAIRYFYLKADANNASTYFKCERNCKIEITYTK